MRLHLIATAGMTLIYGLPALLLLAGNDHFMAELAALGYPAYLAVLLGVSKLAALAAILLPFPTVLKEWAYAGLVFDAVAAIASRLLVGSAPVLILPALAALLLALASRRTRGGAGHARSCPMPKAA